MERVEVKIKQLPHAEDLELPSYQTEGSSGMDILAAVPEGEPIILKPGERQLIPTGLQVDIPLEYEIQIRPRSGLAIKQGITALNTPGTIDADYRGEIKIILINLGQENVVINRGMRIAQMVLSPVSKLKWVPQDKLSETTRSSGGFGSTGVN
jgi:dUTP pyrophosphatase